MLDSWEAHVPRLGARWEDWGAQVPPQQPCPSWGMVEAVEELVEGSKSFYLIFPRCLL